MGALRSLFVSVTYMQVISFDIPGHHCSKSVTRIECDAARRVFSRSSQSVAYLVGLIHVANGQVVAEVQQGAASLLVHALHACMHLINLSSTSGTAGRLYSLTAKYL